jgi:hypothetical protein
MDVVVRVSGYLVSYPFVLASTCLQSGIASNGIINCLWTIIQHSGFTALWTASWLYFAHSLALGITLTQVERAFKWVKEKANKKEKYTRTTGSIINILEITAKCGVYALFCPISTVIVMRHINAFEGRTVVHGLWNTLKGMWAQGGWNYLYRGAVYDFVMELIGFVMVPYSKAK